MTTPVDTVRRFYDGPRQRRRPLLPKKQELFDRGRRIGETQLRDAHIFAGMYWVVVHDAKPDSKWDLLPVSFRHYRSAWLHAIELAEKFSAHHGPARRRPPVPALMLCCR